MDTDTRADYDEACGALRSPKKAACSQRRALPVQNADTSGVPTGAVTVTAYVW